MDDHLKIAATVDGIVAKKFHFDHVGVRPPHRTRHRITLTNAQNTYSKDFETDLIQETVMRSEAGILSIIVPVKSLHTSIPDHLRLT